MYILGNHYKVQFLTLEISKFHEATEVRSRQQLTTILSEEWSKTKYVVSTEYTSKLSQIMCLIAYEYSAFVPAFDAG